MKFKISSSTFSVSFLCGTLLSNLFFANTTVRFMKFPSMPASSLLFLDCRSAQWKSESLFSGRIEVKVYLTTSAGNILYDVFNQNAMSFTLR